VLNEEAAAFIGDLLQTPPMVSAAKVGGVPLYKLARKGVEVERKPRLIHIYTFRFSRYEEPVGWFRISCTKGTYVRTLADELGGNSVAGAHLATLRRTEIGRFSVADALPAGPGAATVQRPARAACPAFLKTDRVLVRSRRWVLARRGRGARPAPCCARTRETLSSPGGVRGQRSARDVAIGVFDGVHRGHQQVIRRMVEEGHRRRRTTLVITSIAIQTPWWRPSARHH